MSIKACASFLSFKSNHYVPQRGHIDEPPIQYLKVKYRCAIGVAFIPVWDGGIRLAGISCPRPGIGS